MVCSICATEFLAFFDASAPLSIWAITVFASSSSVSMVREISSVARRVSPARLLTSLATTAKVRPASPARIASIVALRARMFVVSAICSISCELLRTCSIAAAKPVTCWVSVSTRSSRSEIWPSDDWIISVPCPKRSIARSERRRASSLASETFCWSCSSSLTVPRRAVCSARRRSDVSMTDCTIPAAFEQPTVTLPQLSGMRSIACWFVLSKVSCFISDRRP